MAEEFKDQEPNPLLFALFFVALVAILFSAVQSWYKNHVAEDKKNIPFYQVTNRDFTLFLHENPRFLNINVSDKEAFLPGIQYIQNVSSHVKDADQFIDAPNSILFEYHTWDRLIDYPPPHRLIPLKEFKQFTEQYQEWTPSYWKGSTKGYNELYKQIQNGTAPKELSTLPSSSLPDDIRQAFIGWKNFSFEKEMIENFSPTFEQLHSFLLKYPNFQRNYWINILKDSDPNYLKTVSFDHFDPAATVPEEEISSFLQIALFNAVKAKEEQESQSPAQK